LPDIICYALIPEAALTPSLATITMPLMILRVEGDKLLYLSSAQFLACAAFSDNVSDS